MPPSPSGQLWHHGWLWSPCPVILHLPPPWEKQCARNWQCNCSKSPFPFTLPQFNPPTLSQYSHEQPRWTSISLGPSPEPAQVKGDTWHHQGLASPFAQGWASSLNLNSSHDPHTSETKPKPYHKALKSTQLEQPPACHSERHKRALLPQPQDMGCTLPLGGHSPQQWAPRASLAPN